MTKHLLVEVSRLLGFDIAAIILTMFQKIAILVSALSEHQKIKLVLAKLKNHVKPASVRFS